MGKSLLVVFFAAALVISFTAVGCKGKVENVEDMPAETTVMTTTQGENIAAIEPAQTVAMTETIPPTAAPALVTKPVQTVQELASRSKDIQTALKNAGFYTGAIDGKIGPKSKQAIMAFQKEKGLQVDGKVGPKTWAELEKYLTVVQE